MEGYLRRTVDAELDDLLPVAPAIALDGPKGVGKTETALRRVVTSWLLDDPHQRNLARSDFWLKSLPDGPVLLDEWQHVPSLWDSVRRHVDDGAPPGRFLLTGSATPHDADGTHSGAGRILSLRMRPMGLHERAFVQPTVSLAELLEPGEQEIGGETDFALPDYVDAIVDSGFPSTRQAPAQLRRRFLDTYLQRIVDRDLPDHGLRVRRPETLRRWLSAYAAATSTPTSYSRLLDASTGGDGALPAKTTTISYRDHLAGIWVLDPVPGWIPANNPLRRLQQAPKHHLADPALAARLLGLSARALLSSGGVHMLGPLFESLATLTIRVLACALEARTFHLRAHGGDREIDLIVEGADGQVLPIEVKLAADVTAREVRHLLWLREQIPDRVVDLVVVTTGEHAYRRSDGIAVIPLALLGL